MRSAVGSPSTLENGTCLHELPHPLMGQGGHYCTEGPFPSKLDEHRRYRSYCGRTDTRLRSSFEICHCRVQPWILASCVPLAVSRAILMHLRCSPYLHVCHRGDNSPPARMRGYGRFLSSFPIGYPGMVLRASIKSCWKPHSISPASLRIPAVSPATSSTRQFQYIQSPVTHSSYQHAFLLSSHCGRGPPGPCQRFSCCQSPQHRFLGGASPKKYRHY